MSKRKRAAKAAAKDLIPNAMPPNAYNAKGQLYPIVRLKNPHNPKTYYREGSNAPWVTTGYKTWTITDWIERFKGQQPDGRHWDFFGETIDIWEGYSEE